MASKSFNAKNGVSVGTSQTDVIDTSGSWVGTPISTAKGGVPAGGTIGQILVKLSGASRDIGWGDASSSESPFRLVDVPATANTEAAHPSFAFSSTHIYFTVATNTWLRIEGQVWSNQYLRPGGITRYLRPNGVSIYARP